jgi:hypothetical protein
MIESLQAFPDYRLYCCLFFKTELCVFQEETLRILHHAINTIMNGGSDRVWDGKGVNSSYWYKRLLNASLKGRSREYS